MAPMDDRRISRAKKEFAEQLNSLIRRKTMRDGAITNEQLAVALKADNPDLRVSGAYLSALRTGKRSRPSMELLVTLARYFGAPVTDLMDVDDAGDVLDADHLDDLGVRSIATRAVGLDNDSLLTVAAVLDHVRRLQGLPEISDSLNSQRPESPAPTED